MQNDDKIRALLSGTQVKARENLKYRIMQQIETEKALAKKNLGKVNPIASVWSMVTILGVMYALIVALAFLIYSSAGIDALTSPVFFLPVILIGLVCIVFLSVIFYDDRRRSKVRKVK